LLAILLGERLLAAGSFSLTLVEHLGTAVIVAVMVGATLDIYFSKRLAKNVFETTFGYVMPKYLRAEIRELYKTVIVCEYCVIRVRLKRTDSGDIALEQGTVRNFKNISQSTATFPLVQTVDKVLTCGLRTHTL
jgi:hypothetical protein